MITNPAFMLLKSNTKLLPFQVVKKKGKPYLLVDLKRESQSTVLGGVSYVLKEHHLSVYQEYDPKDKSHGLSAFHYTANYTPDLTLHAYFDQYGRYLYSSAKKEDGSPVELTAAHESWIKRTSINYARMPLGVIIAELKVQTDRFNGEIQTKLEKLESLSKAGFNAEYLKVLNQTILAIDELNTMCFSADHRVSNLLRKQQKSILKNKKKPHQQVVEPELKEENEVELKEESSSALVSTTQQETPQEARLRLRRELMLAKMLNSPVEKARLQKFLISKLWDVCDPEDVNFMLHLQKETKRFAGEILKDLFSLVRANEVEQFKILFDDCYDTHKYWGTDFLTIAYFYGYKELVRYLQPLNVTAFIKTALHPEEMGSPRGQELMKKGFLSNLHIALHTEDFEMFSYLLDNGMEDPNVCAGTSLSIPILVSCFHDASRDGKDGFRFAQKLVECGAHVNAVSSETKADLMTLTVENGAVVFKNERAFTITENERKFLGRSPLHEAVYLRHQAGVTMLLQNGAISTYRDANNFTAFGNAAHAEHRPIDRDILIQIKNAGNHDIDERQGVANVTPLYYACQYKCPDSVDILLSLDADPFGPHIITMQTRGGAGEAMEAKISQCMATPLFMAANKERLDIVQKIMEHLIAKNRVIPHKELMRVLLICSNKAIKDYLYPFYYKAKSVAAVSEYKAGHYEASTSLFKDILKRSAPIDAAELRLCRYNLGSSLLKEGASLFSSKNTVDAKQKFNEAKNEFQAIRFIGNAEQKAKVGAKLDEVDASIQKIDAPTKTL